MSVPHGWFLVNPDLMVEPEILAQLRAYAEVYVPALLGVEQVDEHGYPDPAVRRRDPDFAAMLRNPRRGTQLAIPADPTQSLQLVPALSGALMLMSRLLFERLGGWDVGYRLHAEDLDLCRRARQVGATVAVVNTLQVVHLRGVSSRSRPFFVEWHKHCGLWRYFCKFRSAAARVTGTFRGLACDLESCFLPVSGCVAASALTSDTALCGYYLLCCGATVSASDSQRMHPASLSIRKSCGRWNSKDHFIMEDACTARIFSLSLSKHPAVLEGGKSRLLKRFGSLNYWLYVLMKMSKANNVCLVCACGAAVYVECGVSIRPQESVCLTLTKNDVISRKIFIDGRCEAYQGDKSAIEITVLKGCARTGLNMLRSIFVCSGLGMVELPCVFIGCAPFQCQYAHMVSSAIEHGLTCVSFLHYEYVIRDQPASFHLDYR